MSEKATQSRTTIACPTPLVLFGIDSRGKPKAARFGKQHAGLARKAATQLQLQVLAGNDPKIADLAARLPVGRVHATGRTFVPFIRRDLYDQLLAAAGNGSLAHPPSPPASGPSGAAAGSATTRLRAQRCREIGKEIGIGDVVVAHQSLEDGWYAAIVLEANGDMLTLRWRDYPRERKIVRHRLQLALLYPGSQEKTETSRSLRPPGQGKADRVPNNPSANGPALPKDWDQIDLNHLVLAKDDGPGRGWWEAIPIEKAGDDFKLRWRDLCQPSADQPPRLDLALIYPNAA